MSRTAVDQTLTTHAVARLCGVSPGTVVRWIESGRLPAFRTPGGHRRVQRSALLSFCRQHNVPMLEPGNSRRAILVVDDEPLIRGSMVELLAELVPGVPVLTAEDAFQAGQLFDRHHPCLVFLDLVLPGLDGFQLFEYIASTEEGADTAVVAITGSARRGLRQRAEEAGIQRFLRKPFTTESVRRVLEEFLPDE